MDITTDHKNILEKIDRIDPIGYAKSRNYIDGAVTYLSPYISRGIISTRQVLETVLAKGYDIKTIEPFVKELCWRDYFQSVAQQKDLNTDIKQPQEKVSNHRLSSAVSEGATGIDGIDKAIQGLYATGYMHNHCRMYTAALVCNIAQSHWHLPAQWMYYHLLDGDWASNACSWQWVAGANSKKKYYANQENINRYTYTKQHHTFLDEPYETIEGIAIPEILLPTQPFVAETELPLAQKIVVDPQLPTFIYNYYNVDPLWHKDEPGNRILLLEPDHFAQYPISKKCVDFLLACSKNISGIQVYVGSFESLMSTYHLTNVFYKEHPFNTAYNGNEEPRDWIAPEIKGYYPSFFAYWKKVEKYLYKKY